MTRHSSQIIIRGCGRDQMARLPMKTVHRGEPVNVQMMLLEALMRGEKKFNKPWQSLRWAISRDLTIHVYEPEEIVIES